jgi:NAD-dependent deacetylase
VPSRMVEKNFIPPELIRLLPQARRVAVLTGAGVSAESGVPTFRERISGLWEQYRAEELCSVDAFRRDPGLVWRWHTWLADQMDQAAPNPGHLALADWQLRADNFTLITQNIDGLHQRAGSRHVLELHGNIHRLICSQERTSAGPRGASTDIPPRCSTCGAWLRHDVVWFGESLQEEILQEAWAAAASCDLFLVVGTSGIVHPAASLPVLAQRAGAIVIEINTQKTALTSSIPFCLQGTSVDLVPALVHAIREG